MAPPIGSKEMHEMVKKSAMAGRAEAQNNIGASLIHGLNNYERDPEEGWKWVQKAADQNHAKALLALGTAYYDGNEVLGQPDFSKAIPLLEKAAKIGTFEAHDRLGIAYATGNGVKQDEAKAFKHFTIAYGLGSNKAAYRLGTAYALGHPISKSVFLAKHYLEEACLKHDIKEGYALLGDAILELAMDSYGTSLHIPGHSRQTFGGVRLPLREIEKHKQRVTKWYMGISSFARDVFAQLSVHLVLTGLRNVLHL